MNDKISIAQEARRLLRETQQAALATLSKRLAGHPYASAVQFVLDQQTRPVILISRLAEHTKNIQADARVSLLVLEQSHDVQANARLTIVGGAERIEATEDVARRYLRYFPDASRLLPLDFDFYRIAPSKVRFIGGFGAIHWLAGEALAPPSPAAAEIEESAIEHMNRDHPTALRAYCKHLHGVDLHDARMIGLDCDGIDVRGDGRILRVPFPAPVHDADSVRAALIKLADETRG